MSEPFTLSHLKDDGPEYPWHKVIYRMTDEEIAEWIVEEINKLQIALHHLELVGIKLPKYDYGLAEDLLDQLRNYHANPK